MAGRVKRFVSGRRGAAALIAFQLGALGVAAAVVSGSTHVAEDRISVDRQRLQVLNLRTLQMAAVQRDLERICAAVGCAP